jgi:hypothetical protein
MTKTKQFAEPPRLSGRIRVRLEEGVGGTQLIGLVQGLGHASLGQGRACRQQSRGGTSESELSHGVQLPQPARQRAQLNWTVQFGAYVGGLRPAVNEKLNRSVCLSDRLERAAWGR